MPLPLLAPLSFLLLTINFIWNVLIAHIIKKLILLDILVLTIIVFLVWFIWSFLWRIFIVRAWSPSVIVPLTSIYYIIDMPPIQWGTSSRRHHTFPLALSSQTHRLRALSKFASSSAISSNNDTVNPLIGQSWHVYPGILETTSTTVRYCVRLWIFSHTQNIQICCVFRHIEPVAPLNTWINEIKLVVVAFGLVAPLNLHVH